MFKCGCDFPNRHQCDNYKCCPPRARKPSITVWLKYMSPLIPYYFLTRTCVTSFSNFFISHQNYFIFVKLFLLFMLWKNANKVQLGPSASMITKISMMFLNLEWNLWGPCCHYFRSTFLLFVYSWFDSLLWFSYGHHPLDLLVKISHCRWT